MRLRSLFPRPGKWALLRRFTGVVFLALLLVGSYEWFPWFGGTSAATLTLDVLPLVDPLASIEAAIASRTVTWQMLTGTGILLGAALLLGPIFCGWVCPLGLVLDLNHMMRRFALRLFGRKLPTPVRGPIPAGTRMVLLGGLLGIALTASLPVFQIISPIHLLVRGIIFGLEWAMVALLVMIAAEWIWPRLWCRALCPLGALYSLVGRWGWLRVRIDVSREGRKSCRQCVRHCPMGIAVDEDYVFAGRSAVTHPACTRCGSCIDTCPRGVVHLGFKPQPPEVPPEVTPPPRAGHCVPGPVTQ